MFDITYRKDIGIAFSKEPNTITYNTISYRQKSIVTPDIERNIKSIVKDNPKTPYREINKFLREKMDSLNIMPSSSTIQRYLACSGYRKIRLLNKALIKPRNVAKG